MQDKHELRRRYFTNMSRAFASLCTVYARVMDENISPLHRTFDVVNNRGIWFQTEFPTLSDGYSSVYQIDAISPDGEVEFTYWARGAACARGADSGGDEDDDGSNEDQNTRDTQGDGVISRDTDQGTHDANKMFKRGADRVAQDDGYPGWWEDDGLDLDPDPDLDPDSDIDEANCEIWET